MPWDGDPTIGNSTSFWDSRAGSVELRSHEMSHCTPIAMLLLTGSDNPAVKLWDVSSGKAGSSCGPIALLEGDHADAQSTATPGGRITVTVVPDSAVDSIEMVPPWATTICFTM